MSDRQEHDPDREVDEKGIFPDDVSPDAVPDDTVLMGDEDEEEETTPAPSALPAETGELGPGLEPRSLPRKTEQVPQEFRDSLGPNPFGGGTLETEGMTEGLPTEGFAGETSGGSESSGALTGEDDPDEVLVLLDDETGEVSGTEALGTEAMEGADGFTRELGLSTESIEEIGLKSVNPLHAGAVPDGDIDTPDYGDFQESDEPVGVISEITELATLLDPDILGAGDVDDDDDDDGYYEDEYQGFREPDVEEVAPRFRGKTFVVLGSLAAVAAIGFFMFPEIKNWYETNFDGQNTATAGGGDTDPGTDFTPDTDVVDADVGTVPPPDEPELSRTRIAMRDRVQFAVKLGLQWEEREE